MTEGLHGERVCPLQILERHGHRRHRGQALDESEKVVDQAKP
jgi:hypothetical protein